jgi:hypothetical protein
MENFILIEEDNSVLDVCKAASEAEARIIFNKRGWISGDIKSQKEVIDNMEATFERHANQKHFQVLHPTNDKFNHFCKDGFEYTIVCVIKASSKQDAFIQTQNDFNSEYAALHIRSTDVGDIIIDIETGQAWFINNIGFKEILNPESIEIVYNPPAPDPLPSDFITPSLS